MSADVPTADVPNEDVEEFLDELNRQITDQISDGGRFTPQPLYRDTDEDRRTAIDPGDPPEITSASVSKLINRYEQCVEAGELAAAAAIRRRDGLNDQQRIASRIDQFVLGDGDAS